MDWLATWIGPIIELTVILGGIAVGFIRLEFRNRHNEKMIGELCRDFKKLEHDFRNEFISHNAKFVMLKDDFQGYREYVAKEYVNREALSEMKNDLVQAINRLGDRFDRQWNGRN